MLGAIELSETWFCLFWDNLVWFAFYVFFVKGNLGNKKREKKGSVVTKERRKRRKRKGKRNNFVVGWWKKRKNRKKGKEKMISRTIGVKRNVTKPSAPDSGFELPGGAVAEG